MGRYTILERLKLSKGALLYSRLQVVFDVFDIKPLYKKNDSELKRLVSL